MSLPQLWAISEPVKCLAQLSQDASLRIKLKRWNDKDVRVHRGMQESCGNITNRDAPVEGHCQHKQKLQGRQRGCGSKDLVFVIIV